MLERGSNLAQKCRTVFHFQKIVFSSINGPDWFSALSSLSTACTYSIQSVIANNHTSSAYVINHWPPLLNRLLVVSCDCLPLLYRDNCNAALFFNKYRLWVTSFEGAKKLGLVLNSNCGDSFRKNLHPMYFYALLEFVPTIHMLQNDDTREVRSEHTNQQLTKKPPQLRADF